jgi:N utilization substance protein A
MNIEVINIIEQISREKGIEKNILIEALTSAMAAAASKKLPHAKNLHCEMNEDSGELEIYCEKVVVEEVENPHEEVSFQEASKLLPDVELGDHLAVPQVLESYGRIAAQLARQVIMQKVREAEIDIIYKDNVDKKDELVNGIVQRYEHGDLIVELGKAEGILPRREQVFRETFNRGERIRAYVLDVRKTTKNASVILSRTHVGLIQRLFELEVPEISEGMVEIMGIVREPNGRTKIAVRTNDRDIDAVGACVGMRGMRVQSIVQELRGEKIDIVEFSEDPQTYIRNALSPAKISRIIMKEEDRHMIIIVADDQMSLAIGKKGQNVRLAAKLVKWKIDIKGESDGEELSESSLFKTAVSGSNDEDFLQSVKDTKGLGEKIMNILFASDVVTSQGALERGLKGLVELPGIGPKKAEAIIEMSESFSPPSETVVEETDAAEGVTEVEEIEGAEAEPEADEVLEEADDEEQEIQVEELAGVDRGVIDLLIANEFQTLAELSITPIEELIAIEGIEEDVARSVLEQAKQRMAELD